MRKGSVEIGQINKRLTVIGKTDGSAGKHQTLICKCSCGLIKEIKSHNFKLGKHCKCLVIEKTLIGKNYGKINVIELLLKNSETKNKHRGHLYRCKCIQCEKEYNYPTSAILRNGFVGCRCVLDTSLSSKKSIYCNYKNNARVRGVEFNLNFDEFILLTEQNCFYCNEEPTNKINSKELAGEWVYNGIDRINNEKSYTKSNCVTCCKKCNFMKSNLNKNDFFNHIKKIYKHLFGEADRLH